MSKEKLLKVKQDKKSANPRFIRQDIHKKKRLAKLWRKPRGCDSKKRLMKNNRLIVKPGYGTPKSLRKRDKSGKTIVQVTSVDDMVSLDPKEHTVILSKKTGLKNKIKLLNELIQKNFTIHNIKDPKQYIDAKKTLLDKKKKQKQEKTKKDKVKKEVDKKESIEDKLSDDEKKKLEKKEIDRLLTKKF